MCPLLKTGMFGNQKIHPNLIKNGEDKDFPNDYTDTMCECEEKGCAWWNEIHRKCCINLIGR